MPDDGQVPLQVVNVLIGYLQTKIEIDKESARDLKALLAKLQDDTKVTKENLITHSTQSLNEHKAIVQVMGELCSRLNGENTRKWLLIGGLTTALLGVRIAGL